ncbi:HET-domain-containing protein [Ophiobolus disseminans]|uniref:HET-domain-containing protein n=1 Tax=Ophiobolus disseminans TaxID=1469910 RepID=A0A6A6ZBT9_9PLEO|nr:HET-domain-containing protein [Ophiobolus disseminans]
MAQRQRKAVSLTMLKFFDTNGRHLGRVYLCSRVTFAVELDNPYNPFPYSALDVCLDPSSDVLANKMKCLIQDCEDSHETCISGLSASRVMPKRLVRVDGGLQLVQASRKVRYTALSYCWGGYDKHQTQSTNINAREESIEFSNLLRTLQDGILFTRKLGIAHIWIDSLCIVQDDNMDWAEESAKMADVYSGAYVVIAATQAKDATEGFLQRRKDSCTTFSHSQTNKSFEVQGWRANEHRGPGYMVLDDLPLSQRGWCLQEGLLATRVVHFLPSEVYFQCRTTEVCECRLVSDVRGVATRSWPPTAGQMRERETELILSLYWNSIALDCSRRHFTYAEDVLPALSGVAQRTESLCPGAYIAGLWEIGIADQLSWQVVTREATGQFIRKVVVTRPTFSWITSPFPISYFRSVYENISPICTFIRTQVIPATTDPFGKLSYASITLRGQRIRVDELVSALSASTLTAKAVQTRITTDQGYDFCWSDYSNQIGSGFGGYDALCSVLDWSLVIGFGTIVDKENVTMLLLRWSPQDNAYIRVGLANCVPEDWFYSHATERTVTIV